MIELVYLLVMTHITIVCVTLFLHRGQTHRGLEFHPVLSHFMRFWLWLTTGMITKEWVAIHRKHHQNSDKEGDPHSPHNEGIWFVLFSGVSIRWNSAHASN
jgi:stearoyl-CoA desaturase (delta-9 desaturase)